MRRTTYVSSTLALANACIEGKLGSGPKELKAAIED